MCLSCYRDMDYPIADSSEIREAVKSVERVYEISGAGGWLHVQLDDWNIDDSFFDNDDEIYIKSQCVLNDETDETQDIYMDCFCKMKDLSEEHRAIVLAIYYGILEIDVFGKVVMAQDWKADHEEYLKWRR